LCKRRKGKVKGNAQWVETASEAVFLNYPLLFTRYSRLRNRHRARNKHKAWKSTFTLFNKAVGPGKKSKINKRKVFVYSGV
jgi:hypothetical protein